MGRGFSIFLGKHLNDVCKLSEFAIQGFQTICMFFRCFVFFFNSVKYFNKPKPCGVLFLFFFFRCLNCARTLSPFVLFWLSFLFFQFFVHLMSVIGFCQITLLVGMFYPPICFLIHSINVFNKSFCCGNLQK